MQPPTGSRFRGSRRGKGVQVDSTVDGELEKFGRFLSVFESVKKSGVADQSRSVGWRDICYDLILRAVLRGVSLDGRPLNFSERRHLI